MTWLRLRWDTLVAAVGVRRFVIGSIALLALAIVNRLSGELEERGIPWPTEPASWVYAAIVVLAIICWWLVGYGTRLREELEPRLSAHFDPAGGCVVASPIKRRVQRFHPPAQIVDTTEEWEAIYIRALVTAQSKKAVADCVAYLSAVKKRDLATGAYLETKYADSMQLEWATIGYGEITIPPGIRRYCVCLVVDEKEGQPRLNGTWPLMLRDLFKEHARYELELRIVGDGVATTLRIEFVWKGNFREIEARQLPPAV